MPKPVLELWRDLKKEKIRKDLQRQQASGQVLTAKFLLKQLREMGIMPGDHLMVHCSMSKIGYLENGANTLIEALFEAVGREGTVCMPSSPVSLLQLDYARNSPVFDVKETPSAVGAVSETFRKLAGTERSVHPTEPVCAYGRLAKELVKDHFNQMTPYNSYSPWKKLMDAEGKILYVGVTLDNAGTHLHTLEDAVDFKYPVYHKNEFEFTVIDGAGAEHIVKSKVHNPEFSKLRKCDGLIPRFEKDGVLKQSKMGKANCLLLDAKGMFDSMIRNYHERGITMYTPNGEKIKGYDD